MTWEYKLRKGVKFHDGTEFNADAVIWSYEQMISREDSQLKVFFSNIREIEKINNYKIRIKTHKPAPLINQILNSLLIFKDNYIGTGPYHFVELTETDFKLTVFEDYWGDLPAFRNAVFKTIPSKNTRISSFGTGEIDVLTAVPV